RAARRRRGDLVARSRRDLAVACRRRVDAAAATRRSRGCSGPSRAAPRARVPSGRARLRRHRRARRCRGRRRGVVGVRRSPGMTVRIRVDLPARGYDVVVGAGAIGELAPVLEGRRRAALVTQAAIPAGIAGEASAALDGAGVMHETFLIGDGEDHKTLATVGDLCRGFARWGLLRGDAVVVLGGGVVGDTAGFAAAVYHRGVDVVQVPTTLLAMVDSAIGGKTAVNLPEGKNLAGAFHQPLAVLADPGALATLPDREYRCGLGEIAKYALMGDDFVSARAAGLVARDPSVLAEVVARSAAIKAGYVAADELERTGTRAVLNYGHTLAHALETASGHALLHGEAV